MPITLSGRRPIAVTQDLGIISPPGGLRDIYCWPTMETPTWQRSLSSDPLSSPGVTFYRSCIVSAWTAVPSLITDNAWNEFDVHLGITDERVFLCKGSRRLFSWRKGD